MAVTYGFYNSLNHDRMYDALQMSSIFDGIIEDGVYGNIGDKFTVKVVSGSSITVGTGRAWFDHTWTLNDALLPLTVDQSELVLNRYDAVVLEVNKTDSVRANTIKIVRGTPATDAKYPTLTNTELVKQHPLAYVYRKANTADLTSSDIKQMVGTSACPYVVGVLKSFSIDDQLARWEDQWNQFMVNADKEADDALADRTEQFDTWFENLNVTLSGDVAGNLASQISSTNNELQALKKTVTNGEYTKSLTVGTTIPAGSYIIVETPSGTKKFSADNLSFLKEE